MNCMRRALCQCRVGSHWLRVELGQLEILPCEDRHCMQCESNEMEDEQFLKAHTTLL